MDAMEKRIARETLLKEIPLAEMEITKMEKEYKEKLTARREHLKKLQDELNKLNA